MERSSPLYKIRRRGQALAATVLPHEFLAHVYSRIVMKKPVDLKHPQTFNEKIQWMKLHYYPENPLVIQCADKYAVRDYIRSKNLESLLVPLLGSWNRAEEIDWDALPERFILKCNHGCGYNLPVPDKSALDTRKAVRQLNAWLKEDFGLFNIEPHYSKIRPRKIICEEYLGDYISDIKFFCFHGTPRFFYFSNDLIHDRQAEIGYFDMDGNKIPLKRSDYKDVPSVELPSFYGDMSRDAEKLSTDFPFVRVDFFLANGRYYFAELTFTPGGGMMPLNPAHYDSEWGAALTIPPPETGLCKSM